MWRILVMRIYYFGELIEENGQKVQKQKIEQTQLELESVKLEQKQKFGMDSIGDILKELDLNLDIYRPMNRMSA